MEKNIQHYDTLRIAFTGDILLDRGVRKFIEKYSVDSLFRPEIDSVFAANDFVVGNLECPATSIVSPINKRFIFRGEPDWLQTLYEHGITHLNLANNHSMDQGRRGLADTESQIRKHGMIPLGYGTTIAESIEPHLLAETPRKVYLITSLRVPSENWEYLDSVPCVSESSIATIESQIDSLKRLDSKCFVFVMLHWGVEHISTPSHYQVRDAHRLVTAGADCIVGHHPHCLQTVETYNGVPIYYSIGNFIFDQKKPINTRAAIVTATLTANSASFEILQVEIENCVPRLVEE
ncbi:MAG: CapA family protein [Bacteroidales bacterium]|nr:CapA family protein [Bacteroidales bacterium]